MPYRYASYDYRFPPTTTVFTYRRARRSDDSSDDSYSDSDSDHRRSHKHKESKKNKEEEKRPCTYVNPMPVDELKNMDEGELVDFFNAFSTCKEEKCYGTTKPEDLHQSHLRIDTLLHDEHDYPLQLNHKDDKDWKKGGFVQENGKKVKGVVKKKKVAEKRQPSKSGKSGSSSKDAGKRGRQDTR
ncbi:hypothetical protein P280DRAFT_513063 [Massarina eburnea CBS 473.64]|uniref:Uncharacterized protein n=1 Tax=Massarina eburnea CBS 473.64 TaxID=1395130 RepID=A0A6A6SIU1_9PLEO|nr:hypothetical protein P280DRAFT_513063 [Massarina eburnea CBS 473.64]